MAAVDRLVQRVTAGLLLVILLCIGVLFGMLWLGDSYETRVARLNVDILPNITKVVASTGEETLSRPLFWEERRPVAVAAIPPEVVEPVKEEIVELEGVRLMGILLQEQNKTALFEVDGQVIRLQQGDKLKQWVLKFIDGTRVRFAAGRKVTELSIERTRAKDIHLEAM